MPSTAVTPKTLRIQRQNDVNVHIEVLKSYWERCLTKSDQCGGEPSEISCYIVLIAKLLKEEKFIVTNEEPNYHVLFEFAVGMDMFHQMSGLLTKYNGMNLETLKEIVLQFYDILLSCPHYNLFLKEEFLVPMMCTLNFCSRHSSLRIENVFLRTLHTICVALCQHVHSPNSKEADSSLAHKNLFWSICLNPCIYIQKFNFENPDVTTFSSSKIFAYSAGEPLSLCDLLVNYVHRDGSLCWLSRDSLLLLAASSTANEIAGYHMANDSNLCEVLVTDMVVLFTNIPRQLVSSNSVNEWPNLLSSVDGQMHKDSPLEKFLNHYEFCCSILDISNYVVKENMLNCLYRGFLLPVLAPEIQSTSEPELATATVYLDLILLKSKGSILLPFLLRFLFSDRNATHSDRLTPQSFRHEITQALEQSFPLSDSLFLYRSNRLVSGASGTTYMDLLIKRIKACNSLIGVATLFLMNTILDLLCEDVAFELILKHLLLGSHAELSKTVSNPSSFFASAGQYLALIPPYSSPPPRPVNVQDECQLQGRHSGDLSLFKNLGRFQDQRWDHLRDSLLEARKLIAERKAACSYWRFTYDIGNPSPSMVSNARMNENVLTPLPQEGLQNPNGEDTLTNQGSIAADKSLQNLDRNQWELDGFPQMVPEEDSILADLEHFSALLREPSHRPAYNRNQFVQNSKRNSQTKFRRHQHKEEAANSDEIKRTSSLYDITFVEMDPDEITDSGLSLPAHILPERMVRSALIRRTSTSSASVTSPRSLELSLTESSEHLPLFIEDITKESGVPHLMRYLDQIPGRACVDNEMIEARFAAYMRQYEETKAELTDNRANVNEALKEIDSGFISVDSALLKTLPSVIGKPTVDVAPFYPGHFLNTILKLVNDIPSNHLYINLQVTRLVTHIMALPLPLMRLQLLSLSIPEAHRLGGNQRLYATLMAVRQRFDCYINLFFPATLKTASDDASAFVKMIGDLRDIVFSTQKLQPTKPRPHGPSVESLKPISWLLSHFRLNPLATARTPGYSVPSKSATALTAIGGGTMDGLEWRAQAMRQLGRIAFNKGSNLDPLKPVKDEKSRDVLVALFVFEEFCHELAALCLEHSVAL